MSDSTLTTIKTISNFLNKFVSDIESVVRENKREARQSTVLQLMKFRAQCESLESLIEDDSLCASEVSAAGYCARDLLGQAALLLVDIPTSNPSISWPKNIFKHSAQIEKLRDSLVKALSASDNSVLSPETIADKIHIN